METTLGRAQSDIQKFKGLADQANALVVERMKQELTWENVPEVRNRKFLRNFIQANSTNFPARKFVENSYTEYTI